MPEPKPQHKPEPSVSLNDGDISADPGRAPWLIVTTNPGKEGLVVAQLKRDSFEVYRPMETKEVSHAGQRVIKATAVFPRHLFIRKRTLEYAQVFGLLGVAWVFPRGVRHAFIEALRSKENDGFIELVDSMRPDPGVQIGDRVKMLDGLIEVVVSKTYDDKTKVAALSGFMNGNSRLIVNLDQAVRRERK